MTARSLPPPTATVAVPVACPHCGGPLRFGTTAGNTTRRHAPTRCARCDRRYELTVTLHRIDGPRLPFAPLAHELPPRSSDRAQRLGIGQRTLHDWAAYGVPVEHADQAAVNAGTTPTNVWGTAYYAATTDITDAVA